MTLRVKVPFAAEPQTGSGGIVVPICTVAAGEANAMMGRIAVERPWADFTARLKKRVNADGTVTIVTEIVRSGMYIIFR